MYIYLEKGGYVCLEIIKTEAVFTVEKNGHWMKH